MKNKTLHRYLLPLFAIALAMLSAFPAFANPEEELLPAVISIGQETPSGPAAECGTSEEPASLPSHDTYLGEFDTTAYCNCSKCSPGFSLTYSGTVPTANHTISADLSQYPIGTQLRIGDIIYTVEDTGSTLNGNWLDIYFNTHEEALHYGRQTVSVYAVES